MDVEVNWLAIVLATISSMVVGAIWYAKGVFGKEWMGMIKLDDKKAAAGAPRALSIAVVSSFIMAYVLAHVTFLSHSYFKNSFFEDAVITAFWMWLGFQAFRTLMHDAFEQRRRKLTAINMGNDFVTIMVMGLIIGVVGL